MMEENRDKELRKARASYEYIRRTRRELEDQRQQELSDLSIIRAKIALYKRGAKAARERLANLKLTVNGRST